MLDLGFDHFDFFFDIVHHRSIMRGDDQGNYILKSSLYSMNFRTVVNCLKLNHHDVLENIAETITEYCTTILDIIKGFCFRFLSDHTHVLFSHRFPYEHLKKNIYFKVGKLMS